MGSLGLLGNHAGFRNGATFGDNRPILDQLSVPSAAAYSLRLLNSNYIGNAIRIRRSSDNAETDIGFVNGVLNESALMLFVGADSGFITIWYDQSGNGNNAIQTTATNQPLIVEAGAIVTSGGKVGIRYVGNNPINLKSLSSPLPDANNFIVNMVYREVSRKESSAFSLHPDPYRLQGHITWSDGHIYFDVGGVSGLNRINTITPIATGTTAIYSFYNTTGNAQKGIVINGITAVTGVNTSSAVDRLEIGKIVASETPNATYSEFIIFNFSTYNNLFKILERNQGAYYGITVG